MGRQDRDVMCTCGHSKRDHLDGSYTAHNVRSLPIVEKRLDATGEIKEVLVQPPGGRVLKNNKPWGCTICNCIAFRAGGKSAI